VPPRKDRGEKLRKKERMLRGKLDGLAEAFASNEIDREALRAGSKRAKAELAEVTAELESIAQVPDATLLTSDDIAATWHVVTGEAAQHHPSHSAHRQVDDSPVVVDSL
jgi:septal ring factor EnvC (AmiA/AmiB activator)